MCFLKYVSLVAIMLLIGSTAKASSFEHAWSKSFGGGVPTAIYSCQGVSIDPSGDIFIAGLFDGDIDLGGGNITCAGGYDVFVAKYDCSGNHIWSQGFGDASDQQTECVVSDNMGNVFLAGKFAGDIDFGGGVLSAGTGSDIFLVKLSSTGSHIWSKAFNISGFKLISGLALDDDGNVFVVGDFSGTLDLGGGTLTSAGSWDVYLAKFDGAGNHLWSQGFGDGGGDYGWDVATDHSGNAIIKGHFMGSIDFGGGSLTSAGLSDIYVAKFNSAGDHLWSQSFGDGDFQYSQSITTDDQGNILITGYFSSSIDFGGGVLTSIGSSDIYLAKFDPAGNHRWSQRFGSSDGEDAWDVITDPAGNCLITGTFDNTIDFGGDPLTSIGDFDLYLAKFDPAGTHLWSNRFGGADDDYAEAIAADVAGNIVMTGDFTGALTFGGDWLSSTGTQDMFLARLIKYAPEIVTVRDVPGDQGGMVNLIWDASGLDTPVEHVITHYSIWRAIDESGAALLMENWPASMEYNQEAMLQASTSPRIRIEEVGGSTYYWYLMTTVNAYYLPGYSLPVATLYDSTDASDGYHYFQVIAHTSDPYEFYTSDPDSGYSVDNVAPAQPSGLAAVQKVTPDGLELTWNPNTEADLSNYTIYRGLTSDFIPSSDNLLAAPEGEEFFDGEWRWDSGYYYKVAARDIHGNESSYALTFPEDVTGLANTPAPASVYLAQNYPNPFHPFTTIRFGIHEDGDISLKIYDTAGRLVRVLVDGRRHKDNYEELWDGTDMNGRPVASGVYFLRLKTEKNILTRKAVLMK